MNRYIIVDLTTGRTVLGVLANTKQGALAWATKHGFYNRFNTAYQR